MRSHGFFKKGEWQADTIAEWVSGHLGLKTWRQYVVCAVVVDDELVGGVVFHDYNPKAGTIAMSAYSTDPRWMSRRLVNDVHGYIFDTCACQLSVVQVSEYNARMLKVARAAGYREFRIPRLRGRSEAEIVLTLGDDEWRGSRFNTRRPRETDRSEPRALRADRPEERQAITR